MASRDIVTQHFESVERVFFVHRFAGASSEGDHSGELSPDFQRANTLEEFRRDIAVRT